MKVLAVNEELAGFDNFALSRELAVRQHNRQEGHKNVNRAAVKEALTPLMDLAFHNQRKGCSTDNLLPMSHMVVTNRETGIQTLQCPACYLAHLDIAEEKGNFDEVWLDPFMIQLQVADYPDKNRERREDHIGMVLEDVDLLLPLTFHPNSQGCSDTALIDPRYQYRRGDGRMEVSCVRCFLLGAKADGDSWDERYQLRVHMWNVRPVHIPGGM